LGLFYRLARCALGVLDLTLAVAFLAQVAAIEQLVLDLLQRKAAAGCVLGRAMSAR